MALDDESTPHKRRVRYSGTHPKRFEQKYKELNPERYADTVQKVLESGKTPAGTHRPIMVQEILTVLNPQPGERVIDVTLGWGGHTRLLLDRVTPGGHVLGLDCDPIELPKTEARLRQWGYGPDRFTAMHTNYAGISKALKEMAWDGADCILADLGVSSMQLDDPTRGFSVKRGGPLDMRMNPAARIPASELLRTIEAAKLAQLLAENSDEPHADLLATVLAGRKFSQTTDLASAVRKTLATLSDEEQTASVRRVFQALRIAVNDEFASLDALLRVLPFCLRPNGRAAILTFHSGEDRRVKKVFKEAHRAGYFSAVADEVTRASPQERHDNPRSKSAKLRWAVRASDQ